MNNYVNYANDFEANENEVDYPNNFHPETEAERYAAEKQIMAMPISAIDPLAPVSNGRITPAPLRATAPVAFSPSGQSSFKPTIGSAFSAFKKTKGGRYKTIKLTRRRYSHRGTHKNGRRIN